MNIKNKAQAEGIMLLIAIVVTIFVVTTQIIKEERVSKIANLSKSISKDILVSPQATDCKNANLALYVWLRSQGYSPLVQIGKHKGRDHMWLQVEHKIFDAVNFENNGKSRFVFEKDEYVVDYRLTYIK